MSRALGGIVFGAPGELAALNSLVWPEIARMAREAAAQLHKVRGVRARPASCHLNFWRG